MLFQFEQSVITCEDTVLVLILAHPDTMLCHGIDTLKKVVDIEDKRGELMVFMRKERAPSDTLMAKRKEQRFECAHCDYASPAQNLTARHVARIHLKSIPPRKCKLCEFQAIYTSILNRHHERAHKDNNNNNSLNSESESSINSKFNLHCLQFECYLVLFTLFTETGFTYWISGFTGVTGYTVELLCTE